MPKKGKTGIKKKQARKKTVKPQNFSKKKREKGTDDTGPRRKS